MLTRAMRAAPVPVRRAPSALPPRSVDKLVPATTQSAPRSLDGAAHDTRPQRPDPGPIQARSGARSAAQRLTCRHGPATTARPRDDRTAAAMPHPRLPLERARRSRFSSQAPLPGAAPRRRPRGQRALPVARTNRPPPRSETIGDDRRRIGDDRRRLAAWTSTPRAHPVESTSWWRRRPAQYVPTPPPRTRRSGS
jgi:hypothetical protein